MKLCLVCHNASQEDFYQDSSLKEALERILKRRLNQDKFTETQICLKCQKSVQKFQSLESEIEEICADLRQKFEHLHPCKRGRKPKNLSDSSQISLESTRKSSRTRKVKIFLNSDNDDIKRKEKILSSMATNCPFCPFAADSEVQIERHIKKNHSQESSKVKGILDRSIIKLKQSLFLGIYLWALWKKFCTQVKFEHSSENSRRRETFWMWQMW